MTLVGVREGDTDTVDRVAWRQMISCDCPCRKQPKERGGEEENPHLMLLLVVVVFFTNLKYFLFCLKMFSSNLLQTPSSFAVLEKSLSRPQKACYCALAHAQ